MNRGNSLSKFHFSFKKCIAQQKTTIHYFLNFINFLFKEFCSKEVESGPVHSSLQNEKIEARLIHQRDASLRLRAFMARS